MSNLCCDQPWLRPIDRAADLLDGRGGIGTEDANCTADECGDMALYTAGGLDGRARKSWLLCGHHGREFVVANDLPRDLVEDDEEDDD